MTSALTGKRVFVAGHRGLLGSALVRRLAREDCALLTAGREELDLTDQPAVRAWIARERPDVVLIAAARVGGVLANRDHPADFLRDNLAIASNLIDAAHRADVPRLLFVGSSAVYPQHARQPIREEALLTGPLDPTHEAYAIAKIAGIKLVQAIRRQHGRDYVSVLPTNLYGPGDNFAEASSHVVPALIRKAHAAKLAGTDVTIWGSGTPLRELLHVDDCAEACLFLLEHYSDETPINLGSGEEIDVLDLSRMVCDIAGVTGAIVHDHTKPDGVARRRLDSSRLMALGWRPRVALRDGLAETYAWFLAHAGQARR